MVTAASARRLGVVVARVVAALLSPFAFACAGAAAAVAPTGRLPNHLVHPSIQRARLLAELDCRPAIGGVTAFRSGPAQSVTITGRCFGTHAPFNGTVAGLELSDASAAPEWNACYKDDIVTCEVTRWTNGEIVFDGFTGAYGEQNFDITATDRIVVRIWNAQSGLGPTMVTTPTGGGALHLRLPSAGGNSSTTTSGDQSSIAASLATPSQAFGSLSHDIAVLAIAAASTLFIAFPAQLFNHTFQENYDEIAAFVRRRLGSLGRRGVKASVASDERRNRLRLVIVVLGGAWLAALLDPSFGFSRKSIETYVSMILATTFSMALGALVAVKYREHKGKARIFTYHALPAGLLIGGACVLTSRLTHFEPGYLYGIVAGVAFSEKLSEKEEAHTATLAILATLVVATVAWLLWDVVNSHATHAGADVPLVVVDNVLAAVFAGGITGSVISLLPLRFLPGGRIVAWHKGAWTAVFIAALTGLTGVLLWPHRGGHSGSAPLTTVLILFIAFGGASVAFWRFFERRKATSEALLAAASEAPTSQTRSGAPSGIEVGEHSAGSIIESTDPVAPLDTNAPRPGVE